MSDEQSVEKQLAAAGWRDRDSNGCVITSFSRDKDGFLGFVAYGADGSFRKWLPDGKRTSGLSGSLVPMSDARCAECESLGRTCPICLGEMPEIVDVPPPAQPPLFAEYGTLYTVDCAAPRPRLWQIGGHRFEHEGVVYVQLVGPFVAESDLVPFRPKPIHPRDIGPIDITGGMSSEDFVREKRGELGDGKGEA